MLRWPPVVLVALLLSCSDGEGRELAVAILDVSPLEVEREGGAAAVSFQADGADHYYYSLAVGLEGRLVASGRAQGGVPQTFVIESDALDPCTNQLVLTAVAPGGAAGSDSQVIFLCPTPGCRGCTGSPPDGDADTDVDADTDADADDCRRSSFPNDGVCDPVSGRCCEGGTCQPDPFESFAEACYYETGMGDLGAWCSPEANCQPGLTCFNGVCSAFCSERGWDFDCPDGWLCYSFRVSVNDGPYIPCPSYGICQPY